MFASRESAARVSSESHPCSSWSSVSLWRTFIGRPSPASGPSDPLIVARIGARSPSREPRAESLFAARGGARGRGRGGERSGREGSGRKGRGGCLGPSLARRAFGRRARPSSPAAAATAPARALLGRAQAVRQRLAVGVDPGRLAGAGLERVGGVGGSRAPVALLGRPHLVGRLAPGVDGAQR